MGGLYHVHTRESSGENTRPSSTLDTRPVSDPKPFAQSTPYTADTYAYALDLELPDPEPPYSPKPYSKPNLLALALAGRPPELQRAAVWVVHLHGIGFSFRGFGRMRRFCVRRTAYYYYYYYYCYYYCYCYCLFYKER